MTPPRDVQDYEAQARELYETADLLTKNKAVDAIAAALRAEGRAALERAAQELADMKCANIQKQGGKIRHSESLIGGIEIAQAVLRRRIAAAKRDLAPAPEPPPTTDPIHEAYLAADEYGQPPSAEAPPPHWRNGRHYGIHVYRGDTPIATFHTVADAQAAVRAYNGSLDRSESAPSKEPPP